MSYHEDYPDEIAVSWCVTARVKAKGKPLVHTTMGGGIAACTEMSDWLEALVVVGDKVSVAIEADLTSDEVPEGSENFRFSASGLGPVAIRYGQEWLAAVGPLEGWGGGGS